MPPERRYCTICQQERDVPAPLLDGMAGAPEFIARALAANDLSARDDWSPREVIAHMADTEIAFGWRIRQILSEDDPLVAWYDEERWAAAFFYTSRDATIALDAFRAVRAANVEIVRGAGEGAWQRTYRQGDVRRTLGELLMHRADHDLQHLRQIALGE